jgi:serine/threonine-protein kinase RsbW
MSRGPTVGAEDLVGTIAPLSDQVIVRIPASTSHVGLVRAAASALAAQLDFTYDRITDLHIAIDEVCSRILATSVPRATRIEVIFTVEEGGLRISAQGDTPMREGAKFLPTWSKAILDSVTRGIEIIDLRGVACATFLVPSG